MGVTYIAMYALEIHAAHVMVQWLQMLMVYASVRLLGHSNQLLRVYVVPVQVPVQSATEKHDEDGLHDVEDESLGISPCGFEASTHDCADLFKESCLVVLRSSW